MKDVENFVNQIPGFSAKPAPYMVEAFGWYLHEVKRAERFTSADIGACFDACHITRPGNITSVMTKLCDKTPARLLKDKNGHRLSNPARQQLAELLPVRASSVKTIALLTSLFDRITDPAQKKFLDETLVCFRYHAYRAAVVMAWNLAFSEVLDRIVKGHLPAFNAQVGTLGFKKAVADRTDFEKLEESNIIAIARQAQIIGKETTKTLTVHLGNRNTAAHPSLMVVNAAAAEYVISDLVENIVLKAQH